MVERWTRWKRRGSSRFSRSFIVSRRIKRVVAGLDAHVIAGGIDPLDGVDVDPENLPLVLDVDHFLEAVGGVGLGRRVGQLLGGLGGMLGQRFLEPFRLLRAAPLVKPLADPVHASPPGDPRRPASSDNRPPARRTRAMHGRRRR